MIQIYKNAEVLLQDGYCKTDLLVEDGKIADIGTMDGVGIDLSGKRILPGLIDIHTHGANGSDFNTAQSESDLLQILDYYGTHGVTTVMATLMTDHNDVLECQLKRIARLAERHPMLKGIHLEGPFLSASYKGAMPEEYLKKPDIDLFHRFQESAGGKIRYITISPELDNAEDFVRAVTAEGVKVSLGHSGADFRTAMRCIDAGAVGFTHVFNAMRPIDHHNASIAVAALTANAYCEAIMDGKHLSPDIVHMLFAVKGPSRLIGITDSLAAAGMPDGQYMMAGRTIRAEGGEVRFISDNTRAGSTLNGFDALHNLARFADITLEQAHTCLSRTPLSMLSLYGRTGSIVCGKDADFIVIDDNNLVLTVCGGQILYDQLNRNEGTD